MLFFVAPIFSAEAQTVSPLRGVLTPESKEITFTLSNPTERTRMFRLSWLHLSSAENGSLHPSSKADIKVSGAAPFLSLSPAALQLTPGESKSIVVRIRDHLPLPQDQEWRTHLLIQSAKQETFLRPVSAGLDLDMTTAISVPVILRTGKVSQNSIRIEDTHLRRLANGNLSLEIQLTRHGNHSVYGAIRADSVPRAGAQMQTIARLENIAVYPENDRRYLSISLGRDSLPAGQFDVTFEGRGEYAGTVFARRIFNVEPAQNYFVPSYSGAPAKSVTTQ